MENNGIPPENDERETVVEAGKEASSAKKEEESFQKL